jgi:hypothetical protein
MDNKKFQELVLQQLQGLAEGQRKLESKVDKLETRMENEVVDKIRALFDDRSVAQDYFASIKDSLARIEDQVESLGRRNIDTDSKLREHDRELRLLRIEKNI